jgi:hypothetical protein
MLKFLKKTISSKFFVEQIEYLGYWITRQGIQPSRKKAKAIFNIKAPQNKKRRQNYASLLVKSTIIATYGFAEVSF